MHIVNLSTIVNIREYRGAAHSICHLNYSVLEEIPIVFHNRSNYGYNFIIKGLAEQFEFWIWTWTISNCL